MHKPLILSFLACLVPWQAYAEETTRILFIGNSYTAQIRNTVKNLIKSSPEGDSTQMEFICPGGKTLDFHQQTKSTTEKIKKGNWDYVVLQDQSQTPAIFPDKFERAAVNLDKMIDAAGAKTVFYQTWGRRDGDKHNRHLFPDYQKMQKVLSTNYRKVAKRCDAVLVPVGDTWAKVRKANPELGNALYKGDGSHPSSQGAYLAACVFYATLFEKSPASLPYQSGHPESETKVILEAVGSPAGKPEPRAFPTNRTLTNAEGHKIEASISGRSKTKVYFKTRSKSFVYDISQLSEASQTMIHRLPINR
ncbi:MAG: DUF4886 domain-containing protein [Verrucomicrobiae bacterium]|nr:DUF4886 domain-containing protein [Verrucomicrobiae bacterium]